MRARGTPIGRLRPASPSPAWPEGRGLLTLRPLLEERRAELRALLAARGLTWIEDPANADPRFARARARQALAGASVAPVRPTPVLDWRAPDQPLGAHGVLSLPREAPRAAFAAAAACVSGAAAGPRGRTLETLECWLAGGGEAAFTLLGARLEPGGGGVLLMRQMRGRQAAPLAPVRLEPGVATVWDGRFEVTAGREGLSIAPALGRLSALAPADRAWLSPLPPAARGAFPVILERDGRPVLAFRAARLEGLVANRFDLWARLATGETPHEGEVARTLHGAWPWNALS